MIGTVVVALIFILITLATAWATVRLVTQARRARAALAAMSKTPTTTVAEARLDEIVELVGVVRSIEAASLVEAPLSGARCVWWRVKIDAVSGSSTESLVLASEACDFHLDDGSGAVARVRACEAKVKLVERTVDPGHLTAAKRLLSARGIERTAEDLLWFEERIDVGAEVYLLGQARRGELEARVPGGPFRPPGFARERLVIAAPEGGELLLGVSHEAALAAKLEADLRSATSIARPFAVITVIFASVSTYVLHYLLTHPF